MCFFVKFAKFLRTPNLQNICKRSAPWTLGFLWKILRKFNITRIFKCFIRNTRFSLRDTSTRFLKCAYFGTSGITDLNILFFLILLSFTAMSFCILIGYSYLLPFLLAKFHNWDILILSILNFLETYDVLFQLRCFVFRRVRVKDNIGQSVIDPQSSRFALLKKRILKYWVDQTAIIAETSFKSVCFFARISLIYQYSILDVTAAQKFSLF